MLSSGAFLEPSLMLLARLTLSGSKGFVFSPTLAAYGVRRSPRKVSLNWARRGSIKSDVGLGLAACAGAGLEPTPPAVL